MGLHRVTPSGQEALGSPLSAPLDGRMWGRVVVDVGTGDGALAYRMAKERPDDLVIGLDPVADNLRPNAVRAARKPSRGGVANLVLVRGSVEDVPGSGLDSVADEVQVMLPWGRLLAGVLCDDPPVRAGLVALGRPGAEYSVVLNCEIWFGTAPLDHADLPEATPVYITDVVAPSLAPLGLQIDEARYLSRDETATLRSTWAKRLGHHRDQPRFLLLRGHRSRRH